MLHAYPYNLAVHRMFRRSTAKGILGALQDYTQTHEFQLKGVTPRELELITSTAHRRHWRTSISAVKFQNGTLQALIIAKPVDPVDMYVTLCNETYKRLEDETRARSDKDARKSLFIESKFRNLHVIERLAKKLEDQGYNVRVRRGRFGRLALFFPEGIRPHQS